MKYLIVRFAVFFITFVIGYYAVFLLSAPPLSVTFHHESDQHESLPNPEREGPSEKAFQPTNPRLIIPGKSVGHLKLGDDRARAIELFGRKDSEYDFDIPTALNCSAKKELHFMDIDDKSSPFHFDYGSGAGVYLRNDKIDQIKIQSEKFKTPEGLTVGSTPKQVRRFYPNIRTFVQLNTQCNCTGGKNLIFWIDEQKGVAFRFQYWQNVKARRLSYIFVFQPGTRFLPEGCVYLETQGWEEIKPFSVETPAGMQEAWEKRPRS